MFLRETTELFEINLQQTCEYLLHIVNMCLTLRHSYC